MITLTPSGRQMAENTHGRGPSFAVLSTLYESGGTMEVEEVMDVTHMDVDRARMVIGGLIKQGHIKEL